MKTRKFLALFLAVLMVIPAAVIPAAADTEGGETATATVEYDTVKYEFTTLTDSEKEYLVPEYSGLTQTVSGDVNRNGRYGEGTGIRYEFSIPSSTMPEKITISGNIYQDVWFKVSFENNFKTDENNFKTEYCDGFKTTERLNPGHREIPMDMDAIGELWDAYVTKYGHTPTTLYLHVDNVSIDGVEKGWGTYICNSEKTVVSLTYVKGTHMNVVHDVFMPLATVTSTTTTDEDGNATTTWSETQYASEAEKAHIYNGGDTSSWYVTDQDTKERTANCRYTDGNKSITYVYNLLTSGTPDTVTWTASTGGQLLLQISVDNFTWTTIYNSTEDETLDSDKKLGNAVRTYDLTAAFKELIKTTPSNTLYIKISDSKTDDGNGGCICYNEFCRLSLIYPQRETAVTGEYVTLDWTVKGEDEATYWLGGTGVKLHEGGYYYCDGAAKGTMRFPLTNIDLSSEVLLTMTNAAQLLVEVSLDNKNWVTAFRHMDIGANVNFTADKQQYGLLTADGRTFDLTAAIAEAATAAKTAGMTNSVALYVRIGDSMPVAYDTNGKTTETGAGWGGQLHGTVTLNARSAVGMGYPYGETKTVVTGPLEAITDSAGTVTGYQFAGDVDTVLPWGDYRNGQFWNSFATGAVDASDPDNLVLLGTHGSGNSVWYVDNGYFTLRYKLPAGISQWEFTAGIGNEAGIYYCYTADEKTPQPIKKEQDGSITVVDFNKYTAVYNYQDNNGGNQLPGTLMSIGAETTDEVYANGGYLQLLFVDYSWWREKVIKESDYTDQSDGWGPKITIGKNYPITLTTYVSTEDELFSTKKMGTETYTITESFTVTEVTKNTTNEYYTIKSDTDAEKKYLVSGDAARLSNQISGTRVDTVNLTFKGDGEWFGRCSDDGYFIYRYKLPVGATKFEWTATVGGEYGIYVAYSDDTIPTEWGTALAKYTAENGQKGIAEKITVTKQIDSADLENAETTYGYVYIKINDEDLSDNGYGGRVCYGSDYPVTMTWTGNVSTEETDLLHSVKSAQLLLTENFGLQFKLKLPATAKGDVEVNLTWASGENVKFEKQDDGSYLCVELLPQQLTETLALSYTGTCMDATTYTSKQFEYSIQDYCRRMIMKNQTDKELVTLLSDILAYGAAAQNYCGDYDESNLATAIGPVGENTVDATKALTFTEFKCPDAVSNTTILPNPKPENVAYKWHGVTLVLDNTMKIRYCFTMSEGTTDLPTITVGNQTIDSDDIKLHSDGYYYFDYAVTAANFGTSYTAKFSGADSYTVTYSVNYYVANNYKSYNESSDRIAELLKTVYNYGVSAKAYVTANSALN